MADPTFGTLVVKCLQDSSKGDLENPDLSAIAAHRFRQALIEAIKDYRSHEFKANQVFFSFTPTSGVASVDLAAAPISKNIRSVDRIWYDDSTGALFPKGGLKPVSFEELQEDLLDYDSASPSNFTARCSWHADKLWLSPYPDATFKIHVSAVQQAKLFEYRWDAGAWTYSVDGTDKADLTVDDETDATFTELGKLYRLRALADVFAGPLRDEKGMIQRDWRALAQLEYDRLKREFNVIHGKTRIQPFMPWAE